MSAGLSVNFLPLIRIDNNDHGVVVLRRLIWIAIILSQPLLGPDEAWHVQVQVDLDCQRIKIVGIDNIERTKVSDVDQGITHQVRMTGSALLQKNPENARDSEQVDISFL